MKKIFDTKVIIVLLIAVIAIWYVSSGSGSPATDMNATSTTPVATTVKKAVTPAKATVSTANQPISLSYQQALEKYTGSLRIQLSGDVFCQASPNNVTFKNGTSIMIDNRSGSTRAVKLGDTYTIPGYGFKIVKLSSATFPAVFLLDCGTQQNVAKVTLQQ